MHAGKTRSPFLGDGRERVIGELGEILDGHDAKLADLVQGVQLGVAQLVSPVTIYIVSAAGSSENQLPGHDPKKQRSRRAAAFIFGVKPKNLSWSLVPDSPTPRRWG